MTAVTAQATRTTGSVIFVRAKLDPANFNILKIFSISWLNLEFVAFSLLVKKPSEKLW
jgi:hypothetical protein